MLIPFTYLLNISLPFCHRIKKEVSRTNNHLEIKLHTIEENMSTHCIDVYVNTFVNTISKAKRIHVKIQKDI